MMSADESTTPAFSLHVTNDSFASRCKDVFSTLDTIEKKHEAYERTTAHSKRDEQDLLIKSDPDESDVTSDARRRRHDAPYSGNHDRRRPIHSDHTRYRNRNRRHGNINRRDNEGFYPPIQRPPRRSRNVVPDYKKHPEKWTSYSLEDVNSSDMSEKSNQRAAFEFLSERRKEREKDKREEKFEIGGTACSKGVISFSRPKSSTNNVSVFQKKTAAHGSHTTSVLDSGGKQHASDSTLCFEDTDADSTNSSQNMNDSEGERECGEIDHSFENTSSFKARKNIRRNIRHKETGNEESM